MSAVKRLLRARSVKSLIIFEADVLGVYNVLPGTSRLSVSWKRGSKIASTKVADVKGGEALWDEKLQLHATLFLDPRNNQFDDKECTFVVRENSKTATEESVYGKVTVNLAEIAQDVDAKEVRFPLARGTQSLPTHLHVVLRARKTNVTIDPFRSRKTEDGEGELDHESSSEHSDHIPAARRKLFASEGGSFQDDLSEQLRDTETDKTTEFIDAEEDFVFRPTEFDNEDIKAKKEQLQTGLVGLKTEVGVLHRHILELKREKEATIGVRENISMELNLVRRRVSELEEQNSSIAAVAEERAAYIDHLEQVLDGVRLRFEQELSAAHKEMEMSCREVASLVDAYAALESHFHRVDPSLLPEVHDSLTMRLSQSTLERLESKQNRLAAIPRTHEGEEAVDRDEESMRSAGVTDVEEPCRSKATSWGKTSNSSCPTADPARELEKWKSDYAALASTADDLRCQLIKTKLQLAEANFERDVSLLERREPSTQGSGRMGQVLNHAALTPPRRWSFLLGK